MGAWIEILFLCHNLGIRRSLLSWERGLKFYGTDGKGSEGIVAPLVGAWIEISNIQWKMTANGVAPLVGAWIEIKSEIYKVLYVSSLLSWERGLKYGIKAVTKSVGNCRSSRGNVD